MVSNRHTVSRKNAANMALSRALLCAAIVFFVLVPFFVYGNLMRNVVVVAVETYEDVVFGLHPSASRAMDYGSRHLQARESMLYDIDRAEYFFKKAEDLDSKYPYVNHQLARIAFLRGEFNTAILFINREIELHGDAQPNSYYIRGLIEGYKRDYSASIKDYEQFLKSYPTNWAALNDYTWVLLKAERFTEAVGVTERGLSNFPDNPWLLNSRAIALFELHRYDEALENATHASEAVQKVGVSDWLLAYPGNDPHVAEDGIATLTDSIRQNMHRIELAHSTSTVQ